MPSQGTPKRSQSKRAVKTKGSKDEKRNTYLLLRAYYITHEQHDFLRWRAYDKGVSQSASIREAIDRLIDEEGPPPKKSSVSRSSQTKKAGDGEGEDS